MKRSSGLGVLYIIAAIILVAWGIVTFKQWYDLSGWLLMFFFFSIAFAFQSNSFLKGLSFTMMIIGVVAFAMYHPQYFTTIGKFKLSILIIPLLQLIMFGMGTELSLRDFMNVMRMPRGI